MFINPTKLLGWRIVRTWPSLLCRASPNLLFEYAEVWRADEKQFPGKVWHDGYVNGCHTDSATIFKSYEEALTVLKLLEPRWPTSVFVIEPVQK